MILTLTPSRKTATYIQLFGGYILIAISTVQGFLLIPIYLTYIDLGAYGYWLTINSVIALISIINFGVGPVVVPLMARAYGLKNYEELILYFASSLVLYIIICIFFILACSIFSAFLNIFLNIEANELKVIKQCFFIATICMVLTILNQSMMDFSNSLLRPSFPIITRIVSQLIGILVILLLLYNGYGLLSIALGLLCNAAVSFVVLLYDTTLKVNSFNYKLKIHKDKIIEIIGAAPAMLSSNIGNKLFEQTPQIIITSFISAEMTTVYHISRKVAEIILTIIRIFNTSILASFSNLAVRVLSRALR